MAKILKSIKNSSRSDKITIVVESLKAEGMGSIRFDVASQLPSYKNMINI